MALVHTIPETDATVPLPVRQSGNGLLPSGWLRSFDGTSRVDYKLYAPVAYAMQALHLAALKDGIRFATTGRFRSYARQEQLFLERFTPGPFNPEVHRTSPSIVRRVWAGLEWFLLRGMAMAATPGTSNHGWGIADDICELDANGKIISITTRGLQWLKDNAHRFGFALDIHEEPWHWHWWRPGHECELTQETVDVLHAHGITVPDLATFGFTAPSPTPPPQEDDDMTPAQAQELHYTYSLVADAFQKDRSAPAFARTGEVLDLIREQTVLLRKLTADVAALKAAQ